MSVSMEATASLAHLLTGKIGVDPQKFASGDALRASMKPGRRDAEPPRWFRRRRPVRAMRFQGMRVFDVAAPRGGSPAHGMVVYLHGGAYVAPLSPLHWLIIDAFAEQTGARVLVPCYALAPERTAAESLAPLDALIDSLRHSGRPVALAGDSAGGGLALAQSMRVRDAGGEQIRAAALLSPWADVTMPSPSSLSLERVDVMLRCAGLVAAGQWWAGSWDPHDPRVSPALGSLDGLPPITIVQGARDVLLPDVLRLYDGLVAAGNDCRMHIEPTGFHVFVGARWTPEARSSLRIGAARIREAI